MNNQNNKAVCALLLGREGSQGFPNKNTAMILGRELMRYPMLAAENSKYITHLFFSTDADSYKEIGRKNNWQIIDRPPELATNTALGEDAYIHAYQVARNRLAEEGKEIEFLVLLMCNAPTILAKTIDEGIEILRQNPSYDSAVTVSKYNMWSPLRARKESSEGLLEPFVPFGAFGDPEKMNCDRDSQGDVWFADMGVSIIKPECLEKIEEGLLPQKWMGKKIAPLKQWGGFDLDYSWQLPLAEHWLKEFGFTETKHPYQKKINQDSKINGSDFQENKEVFIKSNANIHSGTKESVFDARTDEKFKEYRRKWKECPENFIVNDFPIHLDIENTSNCNLNCPMCARTHQKWGNQENGFMEMGVFKKIIDEGVENNLCSIKLSLRGEPLLHPQTAEMVRYALEKGILDIYFNTNALLLNEKICQDLVKSGLPRISISVEGTDQETYEKNRPGASLQKVIANIQTLRKVREECGVSHPQIRIQTVLKQEEHDSFPDYVAFWEKLADEVSYIDFREEGPGINHCGKKGNWACPFLWQRITILWDGTVLPCLAHGVTDHKELILGKVPKDFIKEMWISKKSQKMRELHKERLAHQIPECDQCSYRALELSKFNI